MLNRLIPQIFEKSLQESQRFVYWSNEGLWFNKQAGTLDHNGKIRMPKQIHHHLTATTRQHGRQSNWQTEEHGALSHFNGSQTGMCTGSHSLDYISLPCSLLSTFLTAQRTSTFASVKMEVSLTFVVSTQKQHKRSSDRRNALLGRLRSSITLWNWPSTNCLTILNSNQTFRPHYQHQKNWGLVPASPRNNTNRSQYQDWRQCP